MRIPESFRSQVPYPLDFQMSQGEFLCAEFPDRKVRIHSAQAPEIEKIDFGPPVDVLILCGVGRGFVLQNALHFPLIVVFEPDAQVIDPHWFNLLGERLKVVDAKSWARLPQIRTLLLGRSRKIWGLPIYQEICADFFRQALDLCLPSANPNPTPKLALLQGQHFLLRELSEVMTEQSLDCFWEFKDEPQNPQWLLSLQDFLDRHQPTAFLSVNGAGLDSEGRLAETLYRQGVALWIWFVDDPRPILASFPHLSKWSVGALCWERAYIPYLMDWGMSRVEYLPLAAEKKRWSQGKISPNAELAFVGSPMSGSFLNRILRQAGTSLNSAQIQQFAQEIQAHPVAIDWSWLTDFSHLNPRQKHWLRSFMIHYLSAQKRQELVKTCLDFGLTVYGDPTEWGLVLPQTQGRFKASVSYPTGVDTVYQQHFLQLNSTSMQMPSAVNQRVFDVPSAGALLLTDHQADLKELFVEVPLVVYESMEHLRSLIQDYQLKPQRGVELIQKQRQHIEKNHFYEHRLRQILEWIQ